MCFFKKLFRRKVALICLIFMSVLGSFCYGIGVGKYHWPPYELIRLAVKSATETYQDISIIARTDKPAYIIETHRRSYFALDTDGRMEINENGLPYRKEAVYKFERRINPRQTAIIVMDPWIDAPSDHLNMYYNPIMETSLIPVTKKGLELGHTIIILTNNPKRTPYSTRVHPFFDRLADEEHAYIFYHDNFNDRDFASFLKSQGISGLIYIGFASNMCIIVRPMGMIPMRNLGFKCYFIPEASAAVEFIDTWKSGDIHLATTTIISQSMAEIINMDTFLRLSTQ